MSHFVEMSETPDRIQQTFARCQSEERAAFIAYICAGDPDLEGSVAATKGLIDAGIDMLELGVPFSDPLADGLTNQLAAQRALESGATHASVFEQVEQVRAYAPDLPIVFYTYYNMVFSQGEEAYVERAEAAGVDALLVLDLPPEEAGPFEEVCAKHGMKLVFIVAPTTPETRIQAIAQTCTGFVYYVSRAGVTGARETLVSDIKERVELIKSHTQLPVVVGFGISKPEHVTEVGAHADGVVVGSVLVNCIAQNADDRSSFVAGIQAKAEELIAGL